MAAGSVYSYEVAIYNRNAGNTLNLDSVALDGNTISFANAGSYFVIATPSDSPSSVFM